MRRALILCDITVIVAALIESSVTSLLAQTADKVDDQRVIASEAEKQAPPERVVLRRLNHTEYQNTVRDLLVIDLDLKELLPLDSSAGGFDNVDETLHISSFLMDRHLEATDKALNVAIATG